MTTTLNVKDGGTGITPINGYVLLPASNCAPANNDFGFMDFFGGFFVMMICLIIFFSLIILGVKLCLD